jgi:hypothetical protein
MKTYGEVDLQFHALTSAPHRVKWPASCPGHWVGPRNYTDAVAKRKKIPSLPLPGIEPFSLSYAGSIRDLNMNANTKK